jgi:hypothetical protein
MAEQGSLVYLRTKFQELVGIRAPAEISPHGALDSAKKIVNLQEKLLLKNTKPIDLFTATVATSQLLQWCEQLQSQLVLGSRPSLEDRETLTQIKEKFSSGNLPSEEIKRLTALQYVADPKLGTVSAMETLEKLQARYPNVNPRA